MTQRIKRTLATVSLAGIALSVLFILQNPTQPSPTPPATTGAAPHKTEEAKQTAASYDLPVRLRIPKINVDAPIDPMGLTPEGDMQAPGGLHNVGWYKFGPHPGDSGSAVIAGHFGRSKDEELPVFEQLQALTAGDTIHVEDEKGQVVTFVVRKLQTFGQNETAQNVFSSNDEKAHLNLITCQGAWDSTQQTYADRLVVFSDKK